MNFQMRLSLVFLLVSVVITLELNLPQTRQRKISGRKTLKKVGLGYRKPFPQVALRSKELFTTIQR